MSHPCNAWLKYNFAQSSFYILYKSVEQDWADNTTSTPTQILFPKSVTAEEEAYARGFMDSLEELYRRKGVPAVAQSAVSIAVISSDLW